MTFKQLRILILLCLLAIFTWDNSLSKMILKQWKQPITVRLLVINGDNSPATSTYTAQLSVDSYQAMNVFMAEELKRYGINFDGQVLDFHSIKLLRNMPPKRSSSTSLWQSILWSLKFRYWVWQVDGLRLFSNNIRAVLVYHDPQLQDTLQHSTGLANGKVALVNLFASDKQHAANQIVFLHELLHTLGASDKYDVNGNHPVYPQGYADPQQAPLYPQSFAEIMGGRRPITATSAEIPESLDEVLIGEHTADEIGF